MPLLRESSNHLINRTPKESKMLFDLFLLEHGKRKPNAQLNSCLFIQMRKGRKKIIQRPNYPAPIDEVANRRLGNIDGLGQ